MWQALLKFSGFHSLDDPLFISWMIYSYTRTYNCDNAVRGPLLSLSLSISDSSLSRALLLATRPFSQFIGGRKNNSLDTYSKPRCTIFSDFNLTLTRIYVFETFFIPKSPTSTPRIQYPGYSTRSTRYKDLPIWGVRWVLWVGCPRQGFWP